MVRKVPEDRDERNAAKDAIKQLVNVFKEEYGEALKSYRTFIADEYGDAEFNFDLTEKQARIDCEHSQVRVSDLRELWQEHGFYEGDVVYTSRRVRDHEKDFAHEPNTQQRMRVVLFYNYPEAE